MKICILSTPKFHFLKRYDWNEFRTHQKPKTLLTRKVVSCSPECLFLQNDRNHCINLDFFTCYCMCIYFAAVSRTCSAELYSAQQEPNLLSSCITSRHITSIAPARNRYRCRENTRSLMDDKTIVFTDGRFLPLLADNSGVESCMRWFIDTQMISLPFTRFVALTLIKT